MQSQDNSPEVPESHEAETDVQESAPAAEQPQVSAEAPQPVAAASRGHFLDRFGRGAIASVAVVIGLAVGIAGTSIVGDHDGHHGRGEHRFGMEGGPPGGGMGGGPRYGGQEGPGGQRFGGQGGPQGYYPPGAGTQQTAPGAAQQGGSASGATK
ncbi:MAG: hypothetical protein WCL20_06485 [Actinomycetes bacterium]